MSKSFRNILLMTAGPAVLALAALIYFSYNAKYVSTDNAYVQQDKVSVSSEVGGLIVEANARENMPIRAGDLLFRIDPEPYQLTVDSAEAAIATAKAKLQELEAALGTTQVDIESAQDDIAYYEKEYERQKALSRTSVTSDADLRAAEHNLTSAKSDLATAHADAAEAAAAIATGKSAVSNAEVQLAQARLNLARTAVRAPANGIISQADRLQVGQLMLQALPAVTIVKTDRSWIEANFKETDLTNMKVGQPVDIEVDTYPGLKIAGRVESMGAGTGSEFSILPAQNSNANWVKVTQRVPVRIAIVDKPSKPLIAGLSVHVRVTIDQ